MVNCFGISSGTLYNIFTIYISSFALLVYNLCQYKEKRTLLCGISKSILVHYQVHCPDKAHWISGLLVFVEIVLISLFQHGLVSVVNKLLGNLLLTGANYFGMIFAMPILLLFYCWAVGIDPLKQIDLITPAYPLALFFMKLGCFCSGCCHGIVSNFGIYNPRYDKVEFPVQILEAFTALFLFFFIHFCKNKFQKGSLLPIYIISYCSLRFFSEFLRAAPSFLGPLKVYQILCLTGLLWGVAQYTFLRLYRPAIDRIFENNLPAIVQRRKRSNNK